MEDKLFGRQNDSMSRPPLESTPIGMNKTNGTTSPSDSILFGKKSPEPMPKTIPTDSPTLQTYLTEEYGKENVLGYLDLDP